MDKIIRDRAIRNDKEIHSKIGEAVNGVCDTQQVRRMNTALGETQPQDIVWLATAASAQ
jgi:hypothetical protein